MMRRPPFSIHMGLALLGLFTILQISSAQSPLLKELDFESGDQSPFHVQKGREDSITIVTSPVRAGRHAAKTLLRVTDPLVSKGQRAEFSDAKGSALIEMGKDYWYGLSIWVPGDFRSPADSDAVLFQWHTQQGGPSPMLAIRVKDDIWRITSDATPEKRRTLARLPLEKDRWVDWVVHVKWSERAEGFWTIWKDGVPVVEERGIITQYPEAVGPYAKFGQYHSVSKEVPQNTVFFDEYRIAGPGGSYEQVAPGGKSPSAR